MDKSFLALFVKKEHAFFSLRNLTRIGKAAAAPLWAAQLLTSAKSFGDNPIIGSRRLNEKGLHVGRMKLAHHLAARRRAALASRIDPADRAAFERQGFVVKPNFLPPDLFEAVQAQVTAYRGHAREMTQGGTITRRIALDPANLARLPAVRRIMAMPSWNGLLRYVWSFDAAPMVYIQTILSSGPGGDADPQCTLHADTFHPTVKAWLFLTDVAPDEGPFTYVPGSHLPTPARLAWERTTSVRAAASADKLTRRGSFRISADELPALGLPPPVALAVCANTLVVADTSGFHARGPSARATRRVEIWAYGRRNPFLPWTGLDPWSFAGLGEHRVQLLWRFRDVAERLGAGRNVWRARENTCAFD
jgi:hypothetical protein